MLIIALVLAVIGLASLVAAVVTSNEIIAWVCIGASVIGVLLLIVDALRDRSRGDGENQVEPVDEVDETETVVVQDYPDEAADSEETAVEEIPADDPAPDAESLPEGQPEGQPESEHKN